MKKSVLFLALGILLSPVFAQDQDAIVSAFKESYTYETNGDYTKAIETMKKVLKEDNYEVTLRLGWLHYMAGLFTESITYYQKCVKLMPYSIEAKLGLVYPASALGNWEQVITQYNEILNIDPYNSPVNYRLGLIYYGREKYETAFKYFEKVVNMYPFDYDGLHMLAWTNYRLGKTREAKILFNKTLMLSPDDASAKEGLGLIR
ncbi:MAG: tetratricopeptide repeat protein [Bacteroidetes bacterium]|nr:tetratricopeptide repeat protein [Bacteroidota bacterium]